MRKRVATALDGIGELAIVQSQKNANFVYVNYASAFKYNSSGALRAMRLGIGHWETAQYNNRLQVTQIGLGTTDADQNLLKLEYGFGDNTQNNGSLRSQKISFSGLSQAFEQTYTYDDLNRIQVAEEKVGGASNWKQTFQYDRFGNRRFDAANTTTLGQPNNITNPNIDTATNRFTAGQNYVYDKNGNLTNDAEGRQFLYDAENHQKEIRNSAGTPVGLYEYDGDGRRVKKTSSLETTIFVYNAGGTLVAEYATQLAETQQVSYLTQDHLGSPRVITNENGTVTTRQDFSAFGDETLTAQRTQGLGYKPDSIRQDYTGYQKDDESGGLEFAQARYFNTKHGRFTSIDPLTASATIKNPQTFNRYSYAMNSPYKFTDPLGLLPFSVSEPKDCTKGCVVYGVWIDPDTLVDPESHSGEADTAPATEQTSSDGESGARAGPPASGMKLSKDGIQLLKELEGVPGTNGLPALNNYLDSVHKCTTGWGHVIGQGACSANPTSTALTSVGNPDDDAFTTKVMEIYLKNDIKRFEDLVNSRINIFLTQQQFDALVILSYNFSISQAPKLTGAINDLGMQNREDSIRKEWSSIKYGTIEGKKEVLPGLVKRRAIELDVYFNGVYRNR